MEEESFASNEMEHEYHFEEDDDQDKKLSDRHSQLRHRYYVMWSIIVLCAIFIFGGWLYFINKNFQQINEQAESQQIDASAQVQGIFDEFGAKLKEIDEDNQAILQKNEEEKEQAQIIEQTSQQVKEEIEKTNQNQEEQVDLEEQQN